MTDLPLHISLIEREFARSRARSARRHNVHVLNNIERRQRRQAAIRRTMRVAVGIAAFFGALDILRLFFG